MKRVSQFKDRSERYVPDIKGLLSADMPKDFYKESARVNRLWSELQNSKNNLFNKSKT